MPVSLTSNAITVPAVRKHRTGWRPTGCCAFDAHAHSAMLGELDRVRKQVLENLLEAFGVGCDAAQFRGYSDIEREAPPLCLVPEGTGYRLSSKLRLLSSASTDTVPDLIFEV